MPIVCSFRATSDDVKPARLRPGRRRRCARRAGLCRAEPVDIDANYGAGATQRNAKPPGARSSRCRGHTGVPVLVVQRNVVNGTSPPPGSDIVAEVR
ncbi:MAG: hypothetical protein WB760_01210 [Xanthobacteraceae bacterium]